MSFESLIHEADQHLPQPQAPPPEPQSIKDLSPQDQIRLFAEECNKLVSVSMALKVTDDDSRTQATEFGLQVKQIFKKIEEARDHHVRPLNTMVKGINNTAKIMTDPLKRAENYLKDQISSYAWRLEMERRKAQEEARKVAKELQRKVDAEAAAANIPAPVVPEPVVAPPETKVRTESGTSFLKMVWDFEVTTPAEVPREYLAVNEKAIREAIKNGVRNIPGVKIFEKPQTNFR